MERTGRQTKIINIILLICFLGSVLGAWYIQSRNTLAQSYAKGDMTPFTLIVLTKPALIISFDKDKAVVDSVTVKKPSKDKEEYKKQVLSAANINGVKKYITPKNDDKDIFWNRFRDTLTVWHYKPYIIFSYLYNYSKLFVTGNTDIKPYEFFLLNLTLLPYEISDFTINIKQTGRTAVPVKAAQDTQGGGHSPLTAENRPLIVEVLNASGKKGAALNLTQYLRNLSQKGLLKVDVLQYDNYPTLEEKSRIIAHTDKLAELKQLSLNIGLQNSELFFEKNDSAFCDAKIIIGSDFVMPK
ncbi:LytR cell envelope-related transcriptional attenuator [Parelusimicrobium proximum]|uniref:LytR C-terminal domain-containing protein n=1 Tax=Parelusimicrobium proximum TaxID=3228953 RepID=UPI003D177F30